MKASVLPLRYILLWLMFMALLPANAQQLVMPAALRAGDTIAIVSPGLNAAGITSCCALAGSNAMNISHSNM